MADTTLIIKIPDHLYKLLKEFPSDSNEGTIENVLMKAVENGTPLPEGCGKIIAVQDAVDNLMAYKEIGIFGNMEKSTIRGCIDRIENHVKPLIEVDKTEDLGNDKEE